jgi:hypothetical protein
LAFKENNETDFNPAKRQYCMFDCSVFEKAKKVKIKKT